jgi:hypothetical protein
MNDNVVDFPGPTTVDIPPNQVLQKAIEADLASVIVVGVDKDGKFYLAMSNASIPECGWQLEIAKTILMDAAIGD